MDLITLMVNKGVDVRARHTNSHVTALHKAARCEDEVMGRSLVKLLLERYRYVYIYFDGRVVIQTYKHTHIHSGADPNVEDLRGITPLFFAEHKECALLLVKYGANIYTTAHSTW